MGKKISIAYLIDTISSNMAGTEKQLLNIIQRIERDQFEITIICLYNSPWMLINSPPCEVISLGYQGFLKINFPKVLLRYLRCLNDRKFDVVQTFFEDSMFIGYLGKVLSRYKHSLIVSRRDLGLGIDEPDYHKIFKKIKPFVLQSVDGIATNAMAIKSYIAEHEKIPTYKIQVIGNGLELPVPISEAPGLFKENKADIWIGITANLKPVKRLDIFIRAFAHLHDRVNGIKVRAVVLGEGRLESELIQLARKLGVNEQVHFMGAIDNVNDYLQHIDIGVLCSDNEGLSNAILEYMSCGLPVVATAVGGNCELVDDTNGVCVPAGDYRALGDALAMLVTSSFRKDFGKKSLEKVKNGFTWDVIMPLWVNYYQSLVR